MPTFHPHNRSAVWVLAAEGVRAASCHVLVLPNSQWSSKEPFVCVVSPRNAGLKSFWRLRLYAVNVKHHTRSL